MSQFDVITIGRVGIDVYPLQVGIGLEDVTSFGKFLGGSATNVAVAAAYYTHKTAMLPERLQPQLLWYTESRRNK